MSTLTAALTFRSERLLSFIVNNRLVVCFDKIEIAEKCPEKRQLNVIEETKGEINQSVKMMITFHMFQLRNERNSN